MMLHAARRDRNVPVIVCFGTSKTDADAAFGSALWITKPCAPAKLTAAVYSVWDLKHDWALESFMLLPKTKKWSVVQIPS